MYDWANSVYTLTVMTVFFPIFLKTYWSGDMLATKSTFYLGLANGIGSLIIVILAPILGAIADRGGRKKRFLFFFASLGISMTVGLFFVAQGEWQWAILLFVMASVGFMGANTFNDSLLLSVANESQFSNVSALGYSLGYIGSALLFCIQILMTNNPQWFGLNDASEAVRVSFLTVGIWWAVFSIPLFLWVEEAKSDLSFMQAAREGLLQFVNTFRELRQYKVAFTFLIAYWCYIDGVDTVVRMAVDYGLNLGFVQNDLIIAILITQFVGFPATLFFGYLGSQFGEKIGIYIAIIVYVGVIFWAYFMDEVFDFYLLAVVVGLVQGGIQALSRAYFGKLIPKDKAAEFFGFFNLMGKFAAFLGPPLMGIVAELSGSPRLSILSVIIFFIIGVIVLSRVQDGKTT